MTPRTLAKVKDTEVLVLLDGGASVNKISERFCTNTGIQMEKLESALNFNLADGGTDYPLRKLHWVHWIH